MGDNIFSDIIQMKFLDKNFPYNQYLNDSKEKYSYPHKRHNSELIAI